MIFLYWNQAEIWKNCCRALDLWKTVGHYRKWGPWTLELFHCLPLWKTVLFVSSRAFLLSTPTFLLSSTVENSEATCKKATKCNKHFGGMGSPLASLFPPALLKESEFTFSLGLNVATTECCCLWQWCCCLFSASPGQTATNPLQPPNSSYPGRNPVPCHRLQPTTCSVLF